MFFVFYMDENYQKKKRRLMTDNGYSHDEYMKEMIRCSTDPRRDALSQEEDEDDDDEEEEELEEKQVRFKMSTLHGTEIC